jgi:hypothetical protein
MKHKIIEFIGKPKFFYVKDDDKPRREKNNISKTNIEKIKEFISKFNKFIPIGKNNNELYFNIILYCLWLMSNNDDAITISWNKIN